MKVDKQYLRKLLEVFENSKKLAITQDDFKKAGFNIDEEFTFHMLWLDDKGFITRQDSGPGISHYKTSTWAVIPLRYTASGAEYLEELRKNSSENDKNEH
jgi:hypothetical protein